MQKDDATPEEVKKTGILLGVANVVLWPFYYLDARLGFTASIALSGAVLYQLHEIGKEERPVENGITGVNSFFASSTSDSIDNAFRNVVKGGEKVFDTYAPSSKPK